MNQNENNTQLEGIKTNEVLVTNVAIKTTDVLMTIGAGAFALGGIVMLMNNSKKSKLLKEKEDFDSRIIQKMIDEGKSEEDIIYIRNMLKNI